MMGFDWVLLGLVRPRIRARPIESGGFSALGLRPFFVCLEVPSLVCVIHVGIGKEVRVVEVDLYPLDSVPSQSEGMFLSVDRDSSDDFECGSHKPPE